MAQARSTQDEALGVAGQCPDCLPGAESGKQTLRHTTAKDSSLRKKLATLISTLEVHPDLCVDSMYSITFAWIMHLYKLEPGFFSNTWSMLLSGRSAVAPAASSEDIGTARRDAAHNAQTAARQRATTHRICGIRLSEDAVLRIAKMAITWFVCFALLLTIMLQVILLVVLRIHVSDGQYDSFDMNVATISETRDPPLAMASLICTVALFFYLCGDYGNADKMVLTDISDNETKVTRVPLELSTWTAVLAFLQVAVTHMVLYFSLKVIQAAETIEDALMNSLGLVFVVEIDDRVGSWVASAFKDGQLLFELIHQLIDTEDMSSAWRAYFIRKYMERKTLLGYVMTFERRPAATQSLNNASVTLHAKGGALPPPQPHPPFPEPALATPLRPDASAALSKEATLDGKLSAQATIQSWRSNQPAQRGLTNSITQVLPAPQFERHGGPTSAALPRLCAPSAEQTSKGSGTQAAIEVSNAEDAAVPASAAVPTSESRRTDTLQARGANTATDTRAEEDLQAKAQNYFVAQAFLKPLAVSVWSYLPSVTLVGLALFSGKDSEPVDGHTFAWVSTFKFVLFILLVVVVVASKASTYTLAFLYARECVRRQAADMVRDMQDVTSLQVPPE